MTRIRAAEATGEPPLLQLAASARSSGCRLSVKRRWGSFNRAITPDGAVVANLFRCRQQTELTKRKRFGGATKAADDDDDGHEVSPRLLAPTDEEDDMATAMNRIERMGRIDSSAWGITLEDIGKII